MFVTVITAVIKAIMYITITVEARRGYENTRGECFEERNYLSRFLLQHQNLSNLDETTLNNYMTRLEYLLNKNKRIFPKNNVGGSPDYSLIDELCKTILDPSEVIQNLEYLNGTDEYSTLAHDLSAKINLSNTLLEMLARNEVLPTDNNRFSMGCGKNIFMTDLIYAFILNEANDIEDGEKMHFIDSIKAIFDAMATARNVISDDSSKEMQKPTLELFLRLQVTLGNMLHTLKVAENYLINMNSREKIKRDKLHTLIVSLQLVDQIVILLSHASYQKFMSGVMIPKDTEYTVKASERYIKMIMNMASALFHLAIQSERMEMFLNMADEDYCQIIGIPRNTNSTPNRRS